MPFSAKSTNYIGYLTQLHPTKVYSLTLIYRDKSANILVFYIKGLNIFITVAGTYKAFN